MLLLLSLLVIYRFTKDAIVGSNSISAIEIQHLKAPILNNDLQQFKKPKHIFKDRDPNNWDSIDWESIGLSKNQVQTLLNYKDAIGGFKKKKDLYKCYVLNEFHKNKLNKIVAVYTKRFPINESVKPKVMEGVIKVLSKLKK